MGEDSQSKGEDYAKGPTPVANMNNERGQQNYLDFQHAMTSESTLVSNNTTCLLCGKLQRAHGLGYCTNHTSLCHCEQGIFFLLKECSILLSYLDRASYFPSVYVDEFGEWHRSARGRPLYLDVRRLETLRRLWCRGKLPSEVVKSRGASKSVILLS